MTLRRRIQTALIPVGSALAVSVAALQTARRCLDSFRLLQSLIEQLIRVLFTLLRFLLLLKEIVLIEIHFFEYNGVGRPPRSLSRALIVGLSQSTGRVCSSPALA